MDFRIHVHVWTVNTEQSPLVNYLREKPRLGNFITGVTLTCSSLLCRSTQQCKKHVSTDRFSYRRISTFFVNKGVLVIPLSNMAGLASSFIITAAADITQVILLWKNTCHNVSEKSDETLDYCMKCWTRFKSCRKWWPPTGGAVYMSFSKPIIQQSKQKTKHESFFNLSELQSNHEEK